VLHSVVELDRKFEDSTGNHENLTGNREDWGRMALQTDFYLFVARSRYPEWHRLRLWR
jgi:hypothetical protein